jgi:class 3 adenylate cyclase
VSVLFADLVGFTTFSESRDPEEVRAMLTRYFERARETIEAFGGEVDKFIGDAVTAFWGAKQAQEDDAERAVRAALELVDTVEALGVELGIPGMALRAGVLSGETSVGAGGNEKGLVVGDIVNTASRLQSAADQGTVFVGDSTKQLSERAIRYEAVGEQVMKGKSVPVTAWRAVDVLAQRGGRGRWGGVEAPFVGRDGELRLLKDQLHATTRDGSARLVSIVGEAGIGKSRLAWELLKYLDGLDEVFRWHQGRSPAYGDGVTFWALSEMVKRRAGITTESDEPMKARTRLRTSVAEYVVDAEEREWIEPRLAGLLGLDEMPAGDRSELFAALRTFFQRVSETGSTVLLFEDLHWADPALLDFIEELVDRSQRYPILVITLARPDLLDSHPRWGAARHSGVAMHLGPLAEDDMAELVRGLAPGIPEEVVARITGQAEGIPLYAVEYVRTLLAGGQLVQDDTGYRLQGRLDDLAVPDSLHSLVGARLDRFGEADRDLIQDASVLGQSFTLDGLTALTGQRDNELEQRLSDLIRQEIFRYEDDPRSPEKGQYQFVQSVIREVAYRRLAKTERRDRHVRVAEYMEELSDPELAAVVASHYLNAYEAEPDDSLATMARAALLAAAERAADLKAHEQVLTLCERAIAFTDDHAERAPLQLIAAEAAYGMGDTERAVASAGAALETYRSEGGTEDVVTAANTLAFVLLQDFRAQSAIDLLLPLYDPDVVSADRAALGAHLARAMMMNDQIEDGLDVVEHALYAAEHSDDRFAIADALVTRGSLLAFMGRNYEGGIVLRGGLEAGEEWDLIQPQLRALNNLGAIAIGSGLRSLEDLAARGLEAAVKSGNQGWIEQWAQTLAFELALDGRYEEAQTLADEYDVGDRVINTPAPNDYLDWVRDPTGTTAALKGRWERERATIERTPHTDAEDTSMAAWCAMLDHDYERAVDLATAAMQVPFVDAPLIALEAALWLGDPEVHSKAAEFGRSWDVPGKRQQAIALLIEAGDTALAGDLEGAAAAFSGVIRSYEENEPAAYLNGIRALFAATVGESSAEARDAGAAALQWIVDTGSVAYLKVWEAGLPAQAVRAVG